MVCALSRITWVTFVQSSSWAGVMLSVACSMVMRASTRSTRAVVAAGRDRPGAGAVWTRRWHDQLVPHGAHAGHPAGHLRGADAGLQRRRLPRQRDDPLLGAHVDVGLLQGRILLDPLLDVRHDLVVLPIDHFPLRLGTTVNWLTTFLCPSIVRAISSAAFCSSALATFPWSVITPFTVFTLTSCTAHPFVAQQGQLGLEGKPGVRDLAGEPSRLAAPAVSWAVNPGAASSPRLSTTTAIIIPRVMCVSFRSVLVHATPNAGPGPRLNRRPASSARRQ